GQPAAPGRRTTDLARTAGRQRQRRARRRIPGRRRVDHADRDRGAADAPAGSHPGADGAARARAGDLAAALWADRWQKADARGGRRHVWDHARANAPDRGRGATALARAACWSPTSGVSRVMWLFAVAASAAIRANSRTARSFR